LPFFFLFTLLTLVLVDGFVIGLVGRGVETFGDDVLGPDPDDELD
jgi:hypothetical protein